MNEEENSCGNDSSKSPNLTKITIDNEEQKLASLLWSWYVHSSVVLGMAIHKTVNKVWNWFKVNT